MMAELQGESIYCRNSFSGGTSLVIDSIWLRGGNISETIGEEKHCIHEHGGGLCLVMK